MKHRTRYVAIAAMTLDGKIGRSPHHLSFGWTSKEDKKFYLSYLERCDAIIVGNNTYRTARDSIEKHGRRAIVFSRSTSSFVTEKNEKVVFMNPTPRKLKKYIADRGYSKVAVVGGASVYTWCLKYGFIDEILLTIEPVIFGTGLPLFTDRINGKKIDVLSIRKLNQKGTMLVRAITT